MKSIGGKKLVLLFGLITFLLTSFSSKAFRNENVFKSGDRMPTGAFALPTTYYAFHSSNKQFKDALATGRKFETVSHDFKRPQLKFRKRFKRWSQSSQELRVPVKEIEAASFGFESKMLYVKPHFLSHLHYFLFRLTPF